MTETSSRALSKAPTGISGFDTITNGGLPAGRISLVSGGPGSGKTMFATQALAHGATHLDEPGLLVSFEESQEGLLLDFHGLHLGLREQLAAGRLRILHAPLLGEDLQVTGTFTLEPLLLRLERAIDAIGARRVALDGLSTLLDSPSLRDGLRIEMQRLFRWLKDRGLTSIITAEAGEGGRLTRHGFDAYASDCVVLLDHRVEDHVSKRRLRVVKYRGSAHGADEYPFVIAAAGITLMPITSLGLDYAAPVERLSAGVRDLDGMFAGHGIYRASSTLISGGAGTGKSSLAAAFAQANCAGGERCLYLAYEESTGQIVRNMASIGLDLQPLLDDGSLVIQAHRPTLYGLEEHLVAIFDAIERLSPTLVIMDPITSFATVGDAADVKTMLTRVLDHLKMRSITSLMTNLSTGGEADATEAGVSSLMDTWIIVERVVRRNARERLLHVVKSRGQNHSHETRRLVLSSSGIELQHFDDEDPLMQASTGHR